MGEFWEATAKDAKLNAGQVVEVVGMEGMLLVVKLAEQKA
jgi:membrane protein implicated in regulation of membrane protease activity